MKYGRTHNRQQGTQEPSVGKSNPSSSYPRSGSRASPSGPTPGFKNEYRQVRDAQGRKHKIGRYSTEKLFE